MPMKVITIKMDESQLAQVDELATILEKEPDYQFAKRAGKITRGTAVRILLQEAINSRRKSQQGSLSL